MAFDLPAADKDALLDGLDEIGMTLQQADDIAAWEDGRADPAPLAADAAAHRHERPLHPGTHLRALLAGPEIRCCPACTTRSPPAWPSAPAFRAVSPVATRPPGRCWAHPTWGSSACATTRTITAASLPRPACPCWWTPTPGSAACTTWPRPSARSSARARRGCSWRIRSTPKRCGYLAGKAVIPVADQLAKLRAALDARRDPAFVLCARTDALAVEGIEAAIERAGRYRESGVDMVFVQGADTAETLARVCQALPGPHLANVSQAGGRPS